jgi:hypothetical protein
LARAVRSAPRRCRGRPCATCPTST